MSSIYRKSRDGYFYYQAYIYNPETGKNDKRVFHSLNTKEEAVARKQQIKFDKQYKTKRLLPNHKNKSQDKYKIILILIIIASSIILLINIYKNSSDKNIEIIQKDNFKKLGNDQKEENEIDYQMNSEDSNTIFISNATIVKKNEAEEETLLEELIEEIPQIPDYKIERIEKPTNIFNQIKLFVTVAENTDSPKMKILCEELNNKYSQFSNIIICIYSDNEIGKELAIGNNIAITKNEKKLAWLAMYTYNPVEGSYFDDNPTRYLGGN